MLKPGMSYSQLQDLEKNSPVPDNQEPVMPHFPEEAQAKVDSIRQKLMDIRAKTKGKL